MNKTDRRILFFLLGLFLCTVIFIVCLIYKIATVKPISQTHNNDIVQNKNEGRQLIIDRYSGEYEVYQNDFIVKSFMTYNEAVEFAAGLKNASVKKFGGSQWLWDNTPQFNVYYENSDDFKDFSDFSEAVNFCRQNFGSDIFYRKSSKFIWNSYEEVKKSFIIKDVPSILQHPELARGCEVTSAAMLLNFFGFSADKMRLAEEIEKDTTEYVNNNGNIFYGNPNTGFVGDIYSSSKKGLGVYHKPVYRLMYKYAGNRVIDVTGCNFEDLYYFINKSSPVWVIVNTKYNKLPEYSFEMWNTPDGRIKITYSEHSVLVVGYDENYIYINDPLSKSPYLKKKKSDFISAWQQMGSQAITIYP